MIYWTNNNTLSIIYLLTEAKIGHTNNHDYFQTTINDLPCLYEKRKVEYGIYSFIKAIFIEDTIFNSTNILKAKMMVFHHFLKLFITTYQNELVHLLTNCINVYLLQNHIKILTTYNSHLNRITLAFVVKCIKSYTNNYRWRITPILGRGWSE